MPGPSGSEDRAQLELLQAELQALKGRWGRSLRLQRATPAEAPATAPFPIVLTFAIDPPPAAASHYDVGPVRVQIQIGRDALQILHWGASTAAGGPVSPVKPLPAGTGLAVLSDDLPRLLRNRMAQELTQAWLKALLGSSPASRGWDASTEPYKLSAAASYMQEHFVSLICLVPELVEPYQAEDEHGATVRRYAIVNSDNCDAADEATAAAAAAAPAAAGDGGGDVLEPADRAAAGGDGPIAAASLRSDGGRDRGPESRNTTETASGSHPARPSPTPGTVLPAAAGGASAPQAAVPAVSPPPADGSAAAAAVGRGVAAAAAPAGPRDPRVSGAHAVTRGSAPAGTACAAHLATTTCAADTSGCTDARTVMPVNASEVPAAPAPGLAALDTPGRRNHDAVASTPDHGVPQPPPPPPPPPLPPPGLLSYNVALKELQYLQKRYSQVFAAKLHRDGLAGGAAAATSGPQALLQPGCLTTFELELLPTDPDWIYPAVRVVGQLLPVSDAAYLPSLGLALAGRLPPWLRAALESYMADQLATQAAAAAAAEALAAAAAVEITASAVATEAAEAAPRASGSGGVAAAHGRGPVGRPGRGRSGGGRPYGGGGAAGGAVQEPEAAAPEGTVLLPLGSLRNLLRELENYAGAVARSADEERRRREREEAAAGGDGSEEDGGGSDGDGHGDGVGSRYDDDGYGDGSHRREGGAAAAESSDEYGGSGGGDTSEGDDGDDDDAVDEVRFSGAAGAGPSGGAADTPAAYAVMLEGLQLDNLAAVEVLRANFEISCARCGARDTLSVASAAVAGGGGGGGSNQASASGRCPRCTTAWALVMRPHFVHATSNSLCVLKPEGCRPVDLLPSMMAGQCSECSAVMSLREVQVGLPFSRSCSSCHKELYLSIAAVSFIPRGPPRGGAAGASAGGAQRRAGAGAARRARGETGGGGGGGPSGAPRPGQPLPALGTCKHYRHSYRWLRFPCCGMRFPCDLCHEEAVSDGHPVRWAQRMVCGFCATEQPLALGCRACGRRLAGSAANPSGRNTRFWEGGQGCRDVRRLDRNDPHKWRGRNKTISAKQSRVGPKPWSGKAGGGAGGGD